MIPPLIRQFHWTTVDLVAGWSRTVQWRRGYSSRMGCDVIRYMQAERAAAGLPELTPAEVATFLATLAAVEDERLAQKTTPTAAPKRSRVAVVRGRRGGVSP